MCYATGIMYMYMYLIPEPALTLFEVEYAQLISPPLTSVPSVEYQLILKLHDSAA